MTKILCVLYDDPVNGYPKSYARDDIPKLAITAGIGSDHVDLQAAIFSLEAKKQLMKNNVAYCAIALMFLLSGILLGYFGFV